MAVCLAVFLLLVSPVASKGLPTVTPPFDDLVVPHGYPLERHLVRTGDGYTLALYRIPHGRSENGKPHGRPRPVVYLQHGLLDTSAAFFVNGPSSGLGFVLADNGFDVWAGNTRGNTYSCYSLQQNLLPEQFWDFSLDEIVKYDLPATLQYVLEETGVEKLMYLGHSQGTASAHALFSTEHPITKHISLAFMLSPVAFTEHISSHFLRGLAVYHTEDLLTSLGFHQFLPTMANVHEIAGPFCRSTGFACADIFSILYGYNPANLDPAKWDTYLKYTPAGASMKLMTHWAQGVRGKYGTRFAKYDYGMKCWDWWRMKSLKCNWNMYRTVKPPKYDLSKIRVPLVYYHGGHDALADMEDVLHLKEELAPGVLVEEHVELEYTHLDLIWGIDAQWRVFPKLLETMKRKVLEDHVARRGSVRVT